MINTRNLVANIYDVPSYWVFQYYLNLSEKLTGQDIKIKSIFNPSEKTPSMCLYVDNAYNIDGTKTQQYVYKDFSTGKFGNKIHLIMYLFSLNFANSIEKIINDYNNFLQSESFENIVLKKQNKWKVDYVNVRAWNKSDANFWISFNIGSSVLNKYNVKPLEYYNLILEEENKIDKLKISGPNMYGYFNKNDELYKIYRPYNDKHKFYKVMSYIQGIDQISEKNPFLVICSSLKDAMCLESIGYNVDVIAPDSENTIIKPYVIENLKEKYKKIITLFDDDDAGLNAVKKYKALYDINGIVSPLCKDISDAVRTHSVNKLHEVLKPLLKDTLKL
jgi:hypothetical protein